MESWQTLLLRVGVDLGLMAMKGDSLSQNLQNWFDFIVNIILQGLSNAKAILVEEQTLYYWCDKGVHTFPTGMNSKVNIMARLEFELA